MLMCGVSQEIEGPYEETEGWIESTGRRKTAMRITEELHAVCLVQ